MADYNVILNTNNHSVIPGTPPNYGIDVNYQIPSKILQYQNQILDNLSSQFNGTQNVFNLSVNNSAYYPINDQQLLLTINNTLLKPGIDYGVSGNTITFSSPPASGAQFFGVALVTTADLTRTINFVVDAGSNDMTIGIKGDLTIDVTGEIVSWVLISDRPGILVMDIKKTSYDNYPNFTSITGTEKPFLHADRKNKDEDLTTWNKIINAGDILQFEIESVLAIKQFMIAMKLKL